MEDIFINLNQAIENFFIDAGILAPIFSCLLIIVESLLPILPLVLFISINFIAFGPLLGFLISWIFTVIASYLVYILVKKGLHKWFTKKIANNNKLEFFNQVVNNLTLPKLTVILAMPFTPSSFVNIAAGLTNMNQTKYLISLLVGKLFTVFFWGFLGSSLLEIFSNPKKMIVVLIMLSLSYIISYIIGKKLDINI